MVALAEESRAVAGLAHLGRGHRLNPGKAHHLLPLCAPKDGLWPSEGGKVFKQRQKLLSHLSKEDK